MLDKKTLLGIALGVAGALTAPALAPIVASVGRPFVKDVLKRALLAFETMREKLATVAEDLDDLIAEVRVDVRDELLRKGPPAGRTADANGAGDAARAREPS